MNSPIVTTDINTYIDIYGRNLINEIIKSNIKNGPWLAGGAAVSIRNGITPADYDIFCKNDRQRALLERRLLSNNFILRRTSAFAKTFVQVDTGTKVQIINGNFQSLSKLFNSFDFTICQMATDGKSIVAYKSSIKDDDGRILRINNVSNPLNTLLRISKYSQRGYRLDTYSAITAITEVIDNILS